MCACRFRPGSALESSLRCTHCTINIRSSASWDPADHSLGGRGYYVKVLAAERGHPFSPDEKFMRRDGDRHGDDIGTKVWSGRLRGGVILDIDL